MVVQLGKVLVNEIYSDWRSWFYWNSTGLKKNEQKGCDYRNVDLGDTTRKSGGFIQESYGLYEPKVDVIFHLAALPRIQASFENPNEVFKSNVISH